MPEGNLRWWKYAHRGCSAAVSWGPLSPGKNLRKKIGIGFGLRIGGFCRLFMILIVQQLNSGRRYSMTQQGYSGFGLTQKTWSILNVDMVWHGDTLRVLSPCAHQIPTYAKALALSTRNLMMLLLLLLAPWSLSETLQTIKKLSPILSRRKNWVFPWREAGEAASQKDGLKRLCRFDLDIPCSKIDSCDSDSEHPSHSFESSHAARAAADK